MIFTHIVESCPLTKLNGGLSRLHSADEDAVSWLTNYGKFIQKNLKSFITVKAHCSMTHLKQQKSYGLF